MRAFMRTLLALPLILCACTSSGKLDPGVAPIIATIDSSACAFVPPTATIGPVQGEAICSLAASLINGVLTSLSAPAVSAATSASAVGGKSTVLEDVYFGGVKIATLAPQRAAQLRAALSDPLYASLVQKALAVDAGTPATR
jgi:hypothetical protein